MHDKGNDLSLNLLIPFKMEILFKKKIESS